MSREIIVSSSRAFKESDTGSLLIVTAAVTLTIPNNSSGDFADADPIEMLTDGTGSINIITDSGVILLGIETTIEFQHGYLRLERVSTNSWRITENTHPTLNLVVKNDAGMVLKNDGGFVLANF